MSCILGTLYFCFNALEKDLIHLSEILCLWVCVCVISSVLYTVAQWVLLPFWGGHLENMISLFRQMLFIAETVKASHTCISIDLLIVQSSSE